MLEGFMRHEFANARYAAEHQLAVVDCLEDPDDTLKKKTLELLFKMTKPNNVEVSTARFCEGPRSRSVGKELRPPSFTVVRRAHTQKPWNPQPGSGLSPRE